MKREKTAVEWLVEQIESCKITMYNDGDRKKLISLVEGNLIEQAKAMEKEQINHAYLIGFKDEYFEPNEYYESKYGKDE